MTQALKTQSDHIREIESLYKKHIPTQDGIRRALSKLFGDLPGRRDIEWFMVRQDTEEFQRYISLRVPDLVQSKVKEITDMQPLDQLYSSNQVKELCIDMMEIGIPFHIIAHWLSMIREGTLLLVMNHLERREEAS